ncbi:MAG: peptide chain release factor N(5)-glutamine methyltransferase [bacterium]|nr:peptide chain release factor N(5)-glutamine methyltransferase [bacterium]
MDPKDIVERATTFLQKNNIEEPRKNAEIILSYILNKPICYIYTDNFILPTEIIKSYNNLLIKRAKGIPLQYLTKRVNFYGYDFFIQKGVFIPRSETEILVEKTIEIYERFYKGENVKILDIGTGCGNIAIVIAKEIKNCRIIATDISAKALKTALNNAKKYKVKTKIQFLKTDIFPLQKVKFHIIVSNPPYIPSSEIETLPREVQNEPSKALSGGSDGLDVIKRILKYANAFLNNRGFLLMEIGDRQRQHIERIKTDMELIKFVKDFTGIDRIAIFSKKQI